LPYLPKSSALLELGAVVEHRRVFSVSASVGWVRAHHAFPGGMFFGGQPPRGAYPTAATPRLKVPRSMDVAKFWLRSDGTLGYLAVERGRSRPDPGLERSLTGPALRRVSRLEAAAGRFRQDTQVPFVRATSVVRPGPRINAPFLEPQETGDEGPAVRGWLRKTLAVSV
jgi:hypothetical protein